jgi:hypothetical protein
MKQLSVHGFLVPLALCASVLFLSAQLCAQTLPSTASAPASWFSTTGSFSIVPVDTWGSGDFDALSDALSGYKTPRLNQLAIDMDQTASTTYEGELFFKVLRLKVGLNVDVDNNLVGKLDRLMGYINYDGFTLRVQTSELRGTAVWTGADLAGMPSSTRFDNPFISVDLLYYRQTGGLDYFGLGYTSYHLPVQLTILTWDPARNSVWWAKQSTAYQPDMAFQIYSLLFGLDTLHEAFTKTGTLARMQGFGFWAATQDRAGAGISYISDETKGWIEAANPGTTLWSATQIAMLVDYNLILGAQWVGDLGPVRLGAGAGFEIGGQTVMCVTPKGSVNSTAYVDASPSFYLFHYGPVLKGTVSW